MDEADAHAVGPPVVSMEEVPQSVLSPEPVIPSQDDPSKLGSKNQKRIWLLTYCPAGTYITAEMLKDSNIIADECHSTCDRVMNYTYIHLLKKCRASQIEKMFEKVKISHTIVKNEVYGYESIGSQTDGNAGYKDHIAFKMLLKHVNQGNKAFRPWTDGENVLKKGHLFQATGMMGEQTIALEHRTKSQVIAYARELEVKTRHHQGFTAMYMLVSEERSGLFVENASLKHKLEKSEEENASLKHTLEKAADEISTLKRKLAELGSR